MEKEDEHGEASLTLDQVMNLYMRIIYAIRKKGKEKSSMHGRLINPTANGK